MNFANLSISISGRNARHWRGTMTRADIRAQYERLCDNLRSVEASYSEPALLDLAHTLRVWVELAGDAQELLRIYGGSARPFKTGVPKRGGLRVLKPAQYMLAFLPGGVRTSHSIKNLATVPESPPIGGESVIIRMKQEADTIVIDMVGYVTRQLDGDEQMKVFKSKGVKRLNLVDWLGAETVRVTWYWNNGQRETEHIDRKTLIKLVANRLGGSHSNIGTLYLKDRADEILERLFQYKVRGLPFYYFLLLKIAQDIREVFGSVFSHHVVESDQ